MSLDCMFPPITLTDTEQELVAQALSTPAVQKYLRSLARNDSNELLAISSVTTDATVIANMHSVVQGKLQVIATLLSIEAPSTQQSTSQ